uniref:UPF0481 protein At3g47200-like n=1 Tax=Erigeron canadensis TaxID=72917 RepID=UPI001CB8BB24|nr:UPF0481 protein At3g47200-like [Erigeron canadensis]
MNTKLTSITLQTLCRWRSQYIATSAAHILPESTTLVCDSDSDLKTFLHEKLNNAQLPKQTCIIRPSIYKVPDRLRSVEPKAYEPNLVSIGPYNHYHHRADGHHLGAMESTKWDFFHRLFDPRKPDRPNLDAVVGGLEEVEKKARGCYSEDLSNFESNQFNQMMLLDSCFIIELLRETKEVDFRKKSIHIKRWMLPVLQRDLIMLENQLPLFVLNKVYDLTGGCRDVNNNIMGLEKLALEFFGPMIYRDLDLQTPDTQVPKKKDVNNKGLKELALQFFKSMFYRDLDTPNNNSSSKQAHGEQKAEVPKKIHPDHFLELLRASICPTEVNPKKLFGSTTDLKESAVKEPHMFRSTTDLKESGVKVKKAENCQPLEVTFEKGVLRIAPVNMDDYKFTVFRNMVAYEQCHFGCKPYVTAYIFFIDRLINSAEDIELLHYAGVMQHTLGGNKKAAKLVNELCKEVAGAEDDSYLHNVLWKINCYCNDGWNQKRAKLKHEYFYNVWVSLSTFAAIVLIYLAIVQTVAALGDDKAQDHINKNGFWFTFAHTFTVPYRGVQPRNKSSSRPAVDQYIQCFFGPKVRDDIKPFCFMSC